MIYVLGTATLPKIELTEKSLVQLLFAANDVECAAGPLLESDLKRLDLNICDNCGVTFLMMACEFGRAEAVKALICACADVNVAALLLEL
jgi:Ankyrin repeats (many copies)